MTKYIAFDKPISFNKQEIRIPYKIEESESNLIEVYIDSEIYYKVADDYDFENDRPRYMMIDNQVKEFTKDEAMAFQGQILQYQSLQSFKEQKIKELDDVYSKSMFLSINNGFTFQVDLRSKYGVELLSIISNAMGSYTDENKGKKIATFFINIEEDKQQKQIFCACLNWIWQYIFEELLFYVKSTKQLKESYISTIENIGYKDLKELQFEFPKPDGVKINVSNTIKELLNITNDASTDGNKIIVPDYVKEAIRRVNRELFRYTKEDDIKNDINKLLENSWLS